MEGTARRDDSGTPDHTGPRLLLYAVILLAPLPLGGNQPLAILALELTAGLACAWVFLERRRLANPFRVPPGLAVPAGLWIALGLCQLVPVPSAWLGVLAPARSAAQRTLSAALPDLGTALAPVSVSPADTLDALLRLTACVLFGVAAFHAFARRRHLVQLAGVITASAAFQALYGAAELIHGRQQIFGFVKQHYLESATGTFINRNHFAGFLALALPFALTLALRGPRTDGPARSGWRGRLLNLLNASGALGAKRWLAVAAVPAIIAGVFLSASRGGLLAALAGATIVLGWRRGVRARLGLALVFALPALLLSLQPSLTPLAPGERFLDLNEQIRQSDAGRPAVWQTSLRIAADHLVLGTGFGTFETVFRPAAAPSIKLHYRHAHSDWLQLLVEAGLPGFVLLLLLAWGVVRAGHTATRRGDRLELAVLAALVAVGVHALVDFPLRIPAIAALVAILIGVRGATADRAARVNRPRHELRRRSEGRQPAEARAQTVA